MGSSREESNQQSWAGKRIMFFFGEQPFLITIIEIVGVVSLLFSSSADRLFFSAYRQLIIFLIRIILPPRIYLLY